VCFSLSQPPAPTNKRSTLSRLELFSAAAVHPDPFQRPQFHQVRGLDATFAGVGILCTSFAVFLSRNPELLSRMVTFYTQLVDPNARGAPSEQARQPLAVGSVSRKKPVAAPVPVPVLRSRNFWAWPGEVIAAAALAAGETAFTLSKPGKKAAELENKRSADEVAALMAEASQVSARLGLEASRVALLQQQRQEAALRVAEARARVAEATVAADRAVAERAEEVFSDPVKDPSFALKAAIAYAPYAPILAVGAATTLPSLAGGTMKRLAAQAKQRLTGEVEEERVPQVAAAPQEVSPPPPVATLSSASLEAMLDQAEALRSRMEALAAQGGTQAEQARDSSRLLEQQVAQLRGRGAE
jgi:hypothetical protein